ncbi:DUF3037 domain-containing protein [Jatrophihabitans sp.]|uniref:DUF3037 domain-containing protein n=1 Tax=Jatrophihabitans sp. TaxID=1932789 RepID=UPI0030C67F93|nr:hypothetical protein [Jatrophihabitans sp.]
MSRIPFEYVLLRVIPRVERGESINAGVILYSQAGAFLGARVQLDPARLLAVDPSADVDAISAALQAAANTCADDGSGPAAAEEIGRRFRWLAAPRSTVVQPGPIHTGLTSDPAAELDRLLALLVLPVGGA